MQNCVILQRMTTKQSKKWICVCDLDVSCFVLFVCVYRSHDGDDLKGYKVTMYMQIT